MTNMFDIMDLCANLGNKLNAYCKIKIFNHQGMDSRYFPCYEMS